MFSKRLRPMTPKPTIPISDVCCGCGLVMVLLGQSAEVLFSVCSEYRRPTSRGANGAGVNRRSRNVHFLILGCRFDTATRPISDAIIIYRIWTYCNRILP